jgi:hypothetical protein
MAEIAAARRVTPYVGLMFHHNAWASEAGHDFIDQLADRLAALEDIRFARLGAIADEIRSKPQKR